MMISLVTVFHVVFLTVHFGSFVICDICENKKVLSRKKRFLTFPEGSSLQLIYDQIIGVVDHTNLWIVGVTCAMAWPLPNEPYENKLREQFLNETAPPPKYTAIAAIAKRSLPTASRIDRFYLNHHRTTRYTLYETVEKYMNARGKNGTDCIRKALCETGKKPFDQTPMSLVGEIMRAIFSLPPTNEDTKHSSLSIKYDEAFNANQDCQEMYSNCKDSLWTADFIF